MARLFRQIFTGVPLRHVLFGAVGGAGMNGIACSVADDGSFSVGIDLVAGEEPEEVSRKIVDRLRDVAELSRLPPRPEVATRPEIMQIETTEGME